MDRGSVCIYSTSSYCIKYPTDVHYNIGTCNPPDLFEWNDGKSLTSLLVCNNFGRMFAFLVELNVVSDIILFHDRLSSIQK